MGLIDLMTLAYITTPEIHHGIQDGIQDETPLQMTLGTTRLKP